LISVVSGHIIVLCLSSPMWFAAGWLWQLGHRQEWSLRKKNTPAVKEPNYKCAKVDSCKDAQGPDLIENFMVRTGKFLLMGP
jgi:hypothetical protein